MRPTTNHRGGSKNAAMNVAHAAAVAKAMVEEGVAMPQVELPQGRLDAPLQLLGILMRARDDCMTS